MFYLVGIFRTSSPGGSISSNPEKLFQGVGRSSQVIQNFATKGADSLRHQRLLLVKETKVCQVKEFSALLWLCQGLPRGLSGKESTCQAGDMDLIPGLGRPLEKRMATHSSILAWKISWITYSPCGCKESDND